VVPIGAGPKGGPPWATQAAPTEGGQPATFRARRRGTDGLGALGRARRRLLPPARRRADAPPPYGVRDALRAATIGGAIAAGLEGEIGMLVAAARATSR